MTMKKLLSELAKGGVKEFAPFPVDVLLLYFINELTDQGKAMTSMEKKLEQQILAPFHKGKLLISEARDISNLQEKKEFIVSARNEFFSATEINLPDYPLLPIWAHVYVGICYDLLSNPKSALRWYQKAHGLAVELIKVQDEKRVSSDWLDSIIKSSQPYVSPWPQYFNPSSTRRAFLLNRRILKIDLQIKSGDLKRWPLGEKINVELLGLASSLTDLLQSRMPPELPKPAKSRFK